MLGRPSLTEGPSGSAAQEGAAGPMWPVAGNYLGFILLPFYFKSINAHLRIVQGGRATLYALSSSGWYMNEMDTDGVTERSFKFTCAGTGIRESDPGDH